MRSLASCYSEHAIKVSDSYCSSRPSNQSHLSPNSKPSILNSVSNIYQIKLSSPNIFFLTLTWCNSNNKVFNHGGFSFSIAINDSSHKLNPNPQFLRKTKGSKTFNSLNSKIEVFWDLTSAHYDVTSPEPISGFHIIVLVDSERVLFIGDEKSPKLVSRIMQFFGNSGYSTRAQFSDSGIVHDILIKCEEDGLKKNNPELSVNIDNRKIFEIKRLKWNFRGNQIIFLDGLLIDMMWDLHDWFFKVSGSGRGVFTFRTRSGLESRLWLEEKKLGFKQNDFSLFIYACKNPD
ncbi:uncharacterized protein [Euphorbia lathyris]|uniref:uncharacterized protein n=1 Tax=Euphorbia lathyris TaxID=212925 RepID=UPI0033138EF0